METEILSATVDLAAPILSSLRPHEQREMEVLGREPEVILAEAIEKSEAWVMLADGLPVAVSGAIRESVFSPVHIWMVTGERLALAWRPFLKKGPNFTQFLLDRYGIIGGFVMADHEVSIRWLKWLGFSLQGPFPTELVGPVFTFEKRLS